MIILKISLIPLQRLSIFPFVSGLFALSTYRVIRRDASKSLSPKPKFSACLGLASINCLFSWQFINFPVS